MSLKKDTHTHTHTHTHTKKKKKKKKEKFLYKYSKKKKQPHTHTHTKTKKKKKKQKLPPQMTKRGEDAVPGRIQDQQVPLCADPRVSPAIKSTPRNLGP